MSRTAFVLLLLPLAANSLGFPTGGGGGCCCGGGAPACAPLAPPCASSCAPSACPLLLGPRSRTRVLRAFGRWLRELRACPFVHPARSCTRSVGLGLRKRAAPPPPPPPPSNYAGSGTQYEQVNPSAIQKEGQYNEGTGAAAAAGGRLAVVEDAETAAGAELSAVAANATANEPTPPDRHFAPEAHERHRDLREIIEQNISDDLNTSKRLIQIASEAKFGGRFDVICSQNDFSYLSNTELFCQHAAANQVSCYAYRQL
ncbi:Ground-like domain-containing protein [Aphelenchoides fujianensis]|nr:Ground-like domain-containing protein [Aphelenchoides fujianensis]